MKWSDERKRAFSEKVWTPERRKKQSEALSRWKPWESAAGPATEEGKSRSSRNAQKHGLRSREFVSLEAAHSQLKKLLKEKMK